GDLGRGERMGTEEVERAGRARRRQDAAKRRRVTEVVEADAGAAVRQRDRRAVRPGASAEREHEDRAHQLFLAPAAIQGTSRSSTKPSGSGLGSRLCPLTGSIGIRLPSWPESRPVSLSTMKLPSGSNGLT